MRWLAAAVWICASGAAYAAEARRPDVVLIVLDDLGYSDLGCFGGEVRTPNIDALAAGGLRLTRAYNASRCCPTRASLLTGMYPHQVGLARNGRDLSEAAPTLAERLREAGYRTAMAGKWHLSATLPIGGKPAGPEHMAWINHQGASDRPFADPSTYPARRGFERHFGTIWGVSDYFDPFSLVDGVGPVRSVPKGFYLTDAISSKAEEYVRGFARGDAPFFLYVAHCAPHWPLHALPEDMARYRSTYLDGWDALSRSRYGRQIALGIVDPRTHSLPPPSGRGPAWEALDDAGRSHESLLMAAHAAMIDRVDQGVGRIVRALEETGRRKDTLILVMADNGASPERYAEPGFDRPSRTRDGRAIRTRGRFEPGPEDTWAYLGPRWASAVNTPYRLWKAESYDGGCRTPFIANWPAGLKAPGTIRPDLVHVIDVVPTVLDLAGVARAGTFRGKPLPELEGRSLRPVLEGQPAMPARDLFFEHEGTRAVISGDWKAVARRDGPWALFHTSLDATETRDLAASEPARLKDLAERWRAWASRVGAEVGKSIHMD